MDDPTRLTQLLVRFADDAGEPGDPPPLAALHRRRRARRQTFVSAALAVAVVVGVAAGVVATRGPSSPDRPARPPAAVDAARLASYHWSTLPPAPIAGRTGAVAAWTGSEMIIWGGLVGVGNAVPSATGAAYNLETRRWHVLPPAPLSAREAALSAWTGRELIVWGGVTQDGKTARDGARYDPSTRRWAVMAPAPVTEDVYYSASAASWDGHRFLLVAGSPGRGAADALAYDPTTDRWTTIGHIAPTGGRRFGAVVIGVAGSFTLVEITWSHDGTPDSHGRLAGAAAGVDFYRLAPDGFRPLDLSLRGAWSRDIVGVDNAFALPTLDSWCPSCLGGGPLVRHHGAWFTPSTGRYTVIPNDSVLDRRASFVWTGGALLAFDGQEAVHTRIRGVTAAWDPAAGAWRTLAVAPMAGEGEAVWTGDRLLLWGQLSGSLGSISTAGLEFGP